VCELCAPHPLCQCVGSLLLPRTPRGARIREGNMAVPIPRTHAPHRGQGLAGTVRHTCVAKGKAMTEMACAFFCAPPASTPAHTTPGSEGRTVEGGVVRGAYATQRSGAMCALCVPYRGGIGPYLFTLCLFVRFVWPRWTERTILQWHPPPQHRTCCECVGER
jgi:hypothetical protein